MDLEIPTRRFVCVDYPAIVQNTDKMLKTLGGEKAVSKTYNEESRRLELRFRPDDLYCKAACANRQPSTGLLLKVRHKAASSVESGNAAAGATEAGSQSELEADIMGIVDTTYSFNTLADFQYLTMVRELTGEYRSLQPEIHIDRLHAPSWVEQPATLHLPPPIFSRYDHPGTYCFREPPQPREGNVDTSTLYASNFIGVSRQKRPHFTRFLLFTDVDIPTEPYPQVVAKLKNKQIQPGILQSVKQLFEQQPIWSRTSLHCHLPDVSTDEIKYILPTIAYYCLNGPWRVMWVRYGYDMRKDPTSKIYQNLDFRLPRDPLNEKVLVKPKRSAFMYNLPNTVVHKSQSQAALIQQETAVPPNDDDQNAAEKLAQESRYKFRPNLRPAYRQMFYQLCHIEEPEVQRLVHLNDGQETDCTEQDGWCLPDTMEQCRKILSAHLQNLLQTEKLDDPIDSATRAVPAAACEAMDGAVEALVQGNQDPGDDSDGASSNPENAYANSSADEDDDF